MPDGQYKLQWWDAWEGRAINKTRSFSVNGALFIEVPNFSRDIAVKIEMIAPPQF